MNHRRFSTAAIIIALTLVVWFVLSVPHTKDASTGSQPSTATTLTSSVTLRDSYKKGVHTLTGSLEVPNACVRVSAESSLLANDAGILVSITSLDDSGICLQIPTQLSFETSISAPADLPLSISVNGEPATVRTL